MVGGLILGAYWTIKGYHSLDGDQAYRLPLLLHQLDPRVFAADPFVRSFDAFNPHRGSLWLLGGGVAARRPVDGPDDPLRPDLRGQRPGDRPTGARGLARTRGRAGLVAVGLFLIAKAGNIGTNHLFESMLLDRLMGLGARAGWPPPPWSRTRDAAGSSRPSRSGLAAVVHPSLGLQLALIFAGTWLAWALAAGGTSVTWRLAITAASATGLAIVPGLVLNLAPFGSLREGLSPEKFWLLTVELQSPQHMLPHLWRMPQWLAAGAYLVLAMPALRGLGRRSGQGTEQPFDASPRLRLVLMLGVVLFWLACSWVAVEGLRHVGATVFQPFRMATFARGWPWSARSGTSSRSGIAAAGCHDCEPR